jgi:hypothetical protein
MRNMHKKILKSIGKKLTRLKHRKPVLYRKTEKELARINKRLSR